jgi:hypothetical protein
MNFNNNIETSYWTTSSNTIQVNNAHSGNYCCKLNKDSPFSTTFNIRVKDISEKPLQRAKISAWFMPTSDLVEQNLVLDIRDSTTEKSFEWINNDAANYLTELNKWGKIDLLVDLTINNRNDPNNVYRIYASNGKDEPIYVDDFEIVFEE